MKISIAGKKALVTGASRGIGRAVTMSLLAEGAEVIATAQHPTTLHELKESLGADGKRLMIIPADLAQHGAVGQLCATLQERYGAVDIIVNNAGILELHPLPESSDDFLYRSFEVNFFAPFKICRFFAPQMVEQQWGRIINICSSSAYFGGGAPKHCIYSATKHALLGFSRALDEEVRHRNVRVGTVSPAGVQTDMVADRRDLDPHSLMRVEDVAEAVMYLATADGPGIVYEMRMWRMLRAKEI